MLVPFSITVVKWHAVHMHVHTCSSSNIGEILSLVTTTAKLFEVLARPLCIALGDIVRAYVTYVTYVHNADVGILAENVRSSFCVVKFYAIKKACELEGIKFLLISNFI